MTCLGRPVVKGLKFIKFFDEKDKWCVTYYWSTKLSLQIPTLCGPVSFWRVNVKDLLERIILVLPT